MPLCFSARYNIHMRYLTLYVDPQNHNLDKDDLKRTPPPQIIFEDVHFNNTLKIMQKYLHYKSTPLSCLLKTKQEMPPYQLINTILQHHISQST